MAQLAQGTYSVVRVCANGRCGVTLGRRDGCVRKCFTMGGGGGAAKAAVVTKDLAREVVALSATRRSPFVVECHRLSFAPPYPELHMPRMGEDLAKLLRSPRRTLLTRECIRSATRQLLRGVDHCHRRHVVHRDLKPANLLVSFEMAPGGGTHAALRLKIADFGMARHLGDLGPDEPARALTMCVQTVWYRAVEVFLGDPRYGKPVDMWSVGCILWELHTGAPLFPGKDRLGDGGDADTASRIFA